jgi:TRAP-type mannitol/chloroaromatic compound transport system permease small subunit
MLWITSINPTKTKKEIIFALSLLKSFLNYIAGIWLLIGIIEGYSSLGNKINSCGNLKYFNLIYFLFEIIIIGFAWVCVCGLCIISRIRIIIREKLRYKVEQEEDSDEELGI